MLMISQLRLINFQIFEDRTFKFVPGTNVIIGENNGGKSSMIRAMYWLLNNRPAGDWMRRFDPDDDEGERLTTTVILKTVCGHTVKRIKGDTNEYWLDDEKFTSVGRGGPPAPIAELFGISTLPFGKDLIPFIAMQDERPFMVFESAPSKGSLLNYLTGVDVGDRMRKSITKEARQLTAEINNNLSTIEEDKIQLKKYDGLDKLAEKLERAEKLDSKLQTVTKQIDEIQVNDLALCDTDITIIRRKKQITQLRIAIECEEGLQQVQKTIDHLQALNRIGISPKQLKACEAGLKAYEKLHKRYTCNAAANEILEHLYKQWQDAEREIDVLNIARGEYTVELAKYKECGKCSGTGVISQ